MKSSGRKTVKTSTTSAPMTAKAAPTVTAKRTPPTFEEIAKRSFELYLARGGQDGHDVEDWLRAEAELNP
jgi:Protein of unknown function (DUF2934)